MTHYTQYINYHVNLLLEFKAATELLPPFIQNAAFTDADQEFINTFEQLCQISQHSDSVNIQGQWLISRIVSTYSHLTPLLTRDLLWFFGGDCLHYMPDDEISFYQQLDELRFTAEAAGNAFDVVVAKESLSTTH
ncbi:MAG: hypothetical protein ACI9NY_000661 [Kiritimatiellia bacterium]|jgi:hypothetical protein